MQALELKTQTGTYQSHDAETSNVNKAGKFSYIITGTRIEDGIPVVIKKLKNESSVTAESFEIIKAILLNLHTLHPGICKTYDFIKTDDGIFIIREYINGIDLKTLMEDKKRAYFRTPDFTAKIGSQLCDILSAMHSNGLIHRDIKPANIMLEFKYGNDNPDYYNPVVRLIDFELAQLQGVGIFASDKTPAAMIYSPPEQLLRYQQLIDSTSDLFSLAITLFEFLSEKKAFTHANPEILMNLQLNQQLVKHIRIPHKLFAILHKASQKQTFPLPPKRYSYDQKELLLIKGKEQRFQKASEMKAALNDFLAHYDALPPAKGFISKIRAFFR